MSFQWIIDRAESIQVDTRPVVAATRSRNGTVRSVARPGQPWRFTVRLPDGIPWNELRSLISAAENLGRTTTESIQINNPGHSWFTGYSGSNTADPGVANASWTQGESEFVAANMSPEPGESIFLPGDVVQLGSSGRVYRVVSVATNTVTVHRPILENTASAQPLLYGQAVTWNVKCTSFPSWTVFARDQVSWSGAFVFEEDLL